jgi:hypothetical protein
MGAAQSGDDVFETALGVYGAVFSHYGQYIDPALGIRIHQGVHRYVALEADGMHVLARDTPFCPGSCPEYVWTRLLFGSLGVQFRLPMTLVEPYGGASHGVQLSQWHTSEAWERRPSSALFVGSRIPRSGYGLSAELRARGDRYQTAVTTYRNWNLELSAGGYVRLR